MRILAVANPISGGRGGARKVHRLRDVLASRGHDVELYWTRGPGDAAKRSREAGHDVDRIVIAGGDGTLNEVLNGLEDPGRVPIALLPLGTANMLVRELHLPWRPEGVAQLLEVGKPRRLDLGVAGERRFLGLASAGFDAMVTEVIQRNRSGRLGFRGYLRPVFQVLRSYRAPQIEVTVDGGEPLPGSLVIVGNIRNYGGFFSFTDRARADSGLLDVCLLPGTTVPSLVGWALLGFLRRASRRPGVVYRRGRRIVVNGVPPVALQVDGDYAGTTPVEIRVEPGVVPFLV